MFTFPSFKQYLSFSIFLTLLVCVNLSYGQFLVVSTSPTHGTTGVDTAATFSITFNSAIDTTARFPYPGDLFISLYFEPDSLVSEPDSFSFSPDLQTVYFHNLHLSDFTVYRFIINDAVSQSGDSLEIPYNFTFTTNSIMPYTASVSGTINYPGGDPEGAVVILFDANPFETEEDGEVLNWTVVPSTSGIYTIDYVDSSFYWPFVIKDFFIDNSGEIELKHGGALGFLDNNGDNRPDSIYVNVGATFTGQNMTLADIYYQTARDPVPDLLTLAQAWSADAYLIQLGGDNFTANGNSLFWQYAFYSPALMQHKVWFSVGDLTTLVKPDSLGTDTSALPQNWLNSDTVMTIAEAHGGSDFRQQNPDAWVSGGCGYFGFGDDKNKFFPYYKSNLTFSPIAGLDLNILKESQSFSMPAVWNLSYYSESTNENIFFLIDALDGTVLNEAATAAAAEQVAFPIAQNWMPDAKLWGIVNQNAPVDSLGKTDLWTCLYYSATLDSLYGIFVMGQIPFYEGLTGWMPPDTSTVPAGWLDSDVCIVPAENNGGAYYRMSNQNVYVSANLGRWYFGANPDLTVWEFRYNSSTAGELVFEVDAFAGNIVTGIEKPENLNLRDKFQLYQNYPNPFNPETTISFDLPEFSSVTLTIYNLAGQKIAKLLESEITAGNHKITWNAADFASGIYIYKIKTGDYTEIKKCILLK